MPSSEPSEPNPNSSSPKLQVSLTSPPPKSRPEAPSLTKEVLDRIKDRFYSRVKPAPPWQCWLWLGRITRRRGTFSIGNKDYIAHRLAWMLANPDIQINGREIHHTCENPLCVNPAHLSALSPQEHTLRHHPKSLLALAQRQIALQLRIRGPLSHKLPPAEAALRKLKDKKKRKERYLKKQKLLQTKARQYYYRHRAKCLEYSRRYYLQSKKQNLNAHQLNLDL